jgi:hypothetical protein
VTTTIATFAHSVAPLFADYLYIGGGVITAIIVILLILFLVRRV